MPSYNSPNESQCPLLGLSPQSYEEFQARERTRITNINNNWLEQFQDDDEDDEKIQNFSGEDDDGDDGESSENEVLYSEDDDDEKQGGGEDEDEESSGENCIFYFDDDRSDCKRQRRPQRRFKKKQKPGRKKEVPFWYEAEDTEHLSKIFAEYTREVKPEEVGSCGVCPLLKDRRRLPSFIGRIKRTPVFDKDVSSFDEFTTLDKIEIFRRDIRPCGSCTTWLGSRYVVTSWDDDGMPENFVVLHKKEEVKVWRTKAIKNNPVSYIYCNPVWESDVAFQYSVEKEKHDVGYANQPFNYTQYLPKDLLGLHDESEMDG